MKKTICTFLITILSLSLFAQTSVWKVEGNGTTLYLGGTLHILRSQDYPLPKEYDEAYYKSGILVFEADLKELENPANAQKMMMKGMYLDGRTLKSVLSEETYEALKTEFKGIGMPIERVQQFKPSMAISMLTVSNFRKKGFKPIGIDQNYYSRAKRENKKLHFLENIDKYIESLLGFNEDNEDEFISYSLKDLNNIDEKLESLITEWREGSSSTLNSQIEENAEKFPVVYKQLILERNNDWIIQIDEMLETAQKEFILVGLKYIHGEDGLIKQLEDKGYSVEQL